MNVIEQAWEHFCTVTTIQGKVDEESVLAMRMLFFAGFHYGIKRLVDCRTEDEINHFMEHCLLDYQRELTVYKASRAAAKSVSTDEDDTP